MEKFSKRLEAAIRRTGGCLCVGLDVDMAKLPTGISRDAKGALRFCMEIVKSTKDLAAAYKPNLAFFECLGHEGVAALEELRGAVPPECLFVADAKRGDIGNTSKAYADAFFTQMGCDALTVAPYMGRDSVDPFLAYEGTCAFVLCLTSNPSAVDFETQKLADGGLLYEMVARTAVTWGASSKGEVGLVVGATRPEVLKGLRALVPNTPLLIPGVGAQGGDLAAVLRDGRSQSGYGLLVNASRSILYASNGADYPMAARREAEKMIAEMKPFFTKS
jgi:orotidine-5'-phosphate decarboxylase